jgi:hypothetical protein
LRGLMPKTTSSNGGRGLLRRGFDMGCPVPEIGDHLCKSVL